MMNVLQRRNILLDFDGTLIDSRKRMYHLFCELIVGNMLSYEEYWKIKRRRISQKDFLIKYFNYDIDQCDSFKKKWHEKIEEKNRLLLDTPFDGVEDLLENIYMKHDLYMVTARQKPGLVLEQLNRLGWKKYFKSIMVTCQVKSKVELVKENIALDMGDIFIGDTGEDIIAAKELGVKSIAVCSGILDRDVLHEYSPDYIFETILDLKNIILM